MVDRQVGSPQRRAPQWSPRSPGSRAKSPRAAENAFTGDAVCDPGKSTGLGADVRPTTSSWLYFDPLSFRLQKLQRERSPDRVSRRADARVRRLTPCRPTRTRFWRSSSSTSRSGYVFKSALSSARPAKNAKCFFPPPRPRAAIRPPIGVAKALTDSLPPITPRFRP